MTKGKGKTVSSVVGNKVKNVNVNSEEIDDLFNTLSKNKKSKNSDSDSKSTVSTVSTVSSSADDDQNQSEYSDVFDSVTEDESVELVKGTPYDPTRDDFIPKTTNNTASISSDDFFDSRGINRKTRALTEDGLPIFTPKELKIGLGGGTDLCPFDCNCCF